MLRPPLLSLPAHSMQTWEWLPAEQLLQAKAQPEPVRAVKEAVLPAPLKQELQPAVGSAA
jgi:hypothetical protein